jgi:hypothetical protein
MVPIAETSNPSLRIELKAPAPALNVNEEDFTGFGFQEDEKRIEPLL